jgi:hypothetical protein
MSDMEDILKRTIITFPTSIGFVDTEKLLFHISEGIQGEVEYSVDCPKSFAYNEKEKKSKITLRDRALGGVFIRSNKSVTSEFVKLITSDTESTKYSAMRFDPIIGYSVSEHRPEVVKLWDDVRSVVEVYFKNIKSSKD